MSDGDGGNGGGEEVGVGGYRRKWVRGEALRVTFAFSCSAVETASSAAVAADATASALRE
jgi:hypothetical protein